MSPDEAEKAQVEQQARKNYFRMDDGKQNMAPPAEAATWFRFVSVNLDNGPESGIDGDSPGVVTSWNLPGVFVGIANGDLAKVQAKIEGGVWAKDAQASDWAGYAIADVLEIDATEEPGKSRVKAMLKEWIKTGVLKVGQGPNPRRRGSVANRPDGQKGGTDVYQNDGTAGRLHEEISCLGA
jgi:hypothetical protein